MKTLIILFTLIFPYLAYADISTDSKRASQVSFVRGSAELDVAEVSSVECRADSSSDLGGKYFLIYSANDAVKYAIWYNVDAGSTAPTVAAATLVEVGIAADDLAATVCGNTKTALLAITGAPFAVTGTTTLTITNTAYGASTDIADVDTTHTDISKTTDGVIGTALALSSSDVIANLRGFKPCNDAVNTSTYLIFGWATEVTTSGARLDKGKCFVCEDCKAGILSSMYVAAQAASNGFTITQYRQQ